MKLSITIEIDDKAQNMELCKGWITQPEGGVCNAFKPHTQWYA